MNPVDDRATLSGSAEVAACLQRVRVVLHRPSHPGNIGAAARAMKTMGLANLVLVEPRRFPDREAEALAVNAAEIGRAHV